MSTYDCACSDTACPEIPDVTVNQYSITLGDGTIIEVQQIVAPKDGTRTRFTPPNNDFLDDTLKVYVNGVLQPRGAAPDGVWDVNMAEVYFPIALNADDELIMNYWRPNV